MLVINDNKCRLVEFDGDKVRVINSLNQEFWVRCCKLVDTQKRVSYYVNGDDNSCVLVGTNRKLKDIPAAFTAGI